MTDERDLDWVHNMPERLRNDPSKALRIDRSGYVAFISHKDGYRFEGVSRHYDDDEWSVAELAQVQLLGTAARFSHQAEVVEMPDLDDVEVSLEGDG